MDHMFDPNNGRALRMDPPNDSEEHVAFGIAQAAGDLVEQQELRAERERPAQLEPLEVEKGQLTGGLCMVHCHSGQPERGFGSLPTVTDASSCTMHGGHQHVL